MSFPGQSLPCPLRRPLGDRTPPLVRLKAICGPDDDGSPCITVMLPEEDCPTPAAPHGRQPGPRTAFPSPPSFGLAVRVQAMQGMFPAYSEMLRCAYSYIQTDAAGSLTKSRTIMELVVLELYVAEMGKEPKKSELGALLTDNQFTRRLDRRICERMDGVRGMGNVGTHGAPVQARDAERALDDVCEVLV